jgi:hypothetical protein
MRISSVCSLLFLFHLLLLLLICCQLLLPKGLQLQLGRMLHLLLQPLSAASCCCYILFLRLLICQLLQLSSRQQQVC